MIKCKLIRYGSTPMGTFGELHVAGHRFFTVERPWLNNEPFVSCVPAGLYALEAHDSQSHPDVWALVNHSLGVYHFDHPDAIRTAILIHVANVASELAGCIAPGTGQGCPYGKWGVTHSGDAIDKLREILDGEEAQLEIVWQQHGDRVATEGAL
jgi:hypothetical protein